MAGNRLRLIYMPFTTFCTCLGTASGLLVGNHTAYIENLDGFRTAGRVALSGFVGATLGALWPVVLPSAVAYGVYVEFENWTK